MMGLATLATSCEPNPQGLNQCPEPLIFIPIVLLALALIAAVVLVIVLLRHYLDRLDKRSRRSDEEVP